MRNRFDYIDSLRGIAVIMVVLVHVGQTVSGLNYSVEFFTRYGQLGVQLFFLVSAFTLCLSMDSRSEEPFPLQKFFIRRFFRIAPLYYIAIFWYFVVRIVQESIPARDFIYPERFDFTNIVANITFSHGFIPSANNSIVPGGWSIGTEVIFYAIFPVLFIVSRKLFEKRKIYLVYLVVFFLLLNLAAQGSATFHAMDLGYGNFMYFNIVNQLPIFLVGILSYELYKQHYFDRVTTLSAVLLFLLWVFITAVLWQQKIAYSQALVPFCAGLSFVFLLVLFSRVHRLNGALLRHIGELSFSIYLIHFVFARVLGSVFGNLQQFGVPPELILLMHFSLTFGVSYVVSIWTQKHIEQRGIAAGRFLIQWLYIQPEKEVKPA